MTEDKVIQVAQLKKVYGQTRAVDEISFEVKQGEIFGMVGPNGAGKTTTIENIEGLRQPDSGNVTVLGFNPNQNGSALQQLIGVQLQQSSLPHRLKVWEALELFSSFYSKTVAWEKLLQQLGLESSRNTVFVKLSGGQKQRLFIALVLVNDPELIFLDELTTGLDPQARHAMWDLVRDIRDQGKTVFLTTHFMEEAERLCDRVAVMDHGKIVALDSPINLIKSLDAENRLVFFAEGDISIYSDAINKLKSVSRVETIGERMVVYGQGDKLVVEVVNSLSSNNLKFRDLRTEQPNLEDVFLAVTGREMRE